MLGYIRYVAGDPGDVKLFLARDETAVMQVLRFLAEKAKKGDHAILHLPIHSDSACVRDWIKNSIHSSKKHLGGSHDLPFGRENLVVKSYMDQVRNGSRIQGLLMYPPQVEFG